MTNATEYPCLKRIDANCFQSRPHWAKQAFAYRLVHLLTPKRLTKKLPRGIRRALLAPGVMLPPGVELPAGIVVAPGAEIPTGWTAGDPLPPGAIPAPVAPPGVDETGATPPQYVAPWEPGPARPAPSPPPSGAVVWRAEPFDNLTANSWTDLSTFDGVAEIVSGQLKLWAPAAAGRGWIQRTEGTAFPTNWSVIAPINYQSGTGSLRLEIRTGTYRIRMTLDPPDEVTLAGTPAGQTETVDNYLGTEVVWRIASTGSTATVYMDDVPVIEDLTPTIYSSNPGQINLRQYGEMVSLWDYFNLTTP